MSEIQFQGSKIYYETVGAGSKVPLVLLHGFLEDSRIWRDLTEEIKTQRQIICIDLPGHGRSGGVDNVHSMELMASAVQDVLEELQIQEFSIAGHSMGGYVSLELLKNFPIVIRSIMLMNSTPLEDSVEKREIRDRSMDLVARNKSAYVSMAISNLFSEKSNVDLAVEIEILKERAKEMSAENIQAALKGMKNRTNYLEVLKSYTGQKIVVAGKEDPILDFNEIERISLGCECDFYSMENGHNSYMEDYKSLIKIMHFID